MSLLIVVVGLSFTVRRVVSLINVMSIGVVESTFCLSIVVGRSVEVDVGVGLDIDSSFSVVVMSGEVLADCSVDFVELPWSSFVVTTDNVVCRDVVGELVDAMLDVIDSLCLGVVVITFVGEEVNSETRKWDI